MLFLLGIYLATRLGIFFFFADTIYTNNREMAELFCARDIATGLRMPLFHYLLGGDNSFGFIFFSVLMAPFYWIAKTLLFPKLMGILAGLAILVLWYRFLGKYFSDRVAFIFGLLYVFCPTLLLSANFAFAWKPHYIQNALLTIIAIRLFFRIFYEKDTRMVNYAWLGLIWATGIWIDSIFVVIVIVQVIFWFLEDKNLLLQRNFLVMGGFFLLGSLPWMWWHVSHMLKGYTGFQGVELSFSDLGKTGNLVLDRIPQIFCYYGAPFITRYIYCLVFLFAFGTLVFQHRNVLSALIRTFGDMNGRTGVTSSTIPKEAVLILYVPVFLSLVVVGTHGAPGIRYFSSLFPFIFAVIALALHTLPVSSRRFFGWLLIISLVLLSLCDISKRIPYFSVDRLAVYKAYEGDHLFGNLLHLHRYDLPKLKEFLRQDENARGAVISGYLDGCHISLYVEMLGQHIFNPREVLIFREMIPELVYATIYERLTPHPPVDINAIVNMVITALVMEDELRCCSPFRFFPRVEVWTMPDAVTPRALSFCKLLAMGEKAPFVHITSERLRYVDIADIRRALGALSLDEKQRVIFYESLGVIATYHRSRAVASPEIFLEGIPEGHRKDFLEGFGHGVFKHYLNKKLLHEAFATTGDWWERTMDDMSKEIEGYPALKSEYRGYLFTGIFSRVHRYHSFRFTQYPGYFMPYSDIISLYGRIDTRVPAYYRPFIYTGIGKGLGLEMVLWKEWPKQRVMFFIDKIKADYRSYAVEAFSTVVGNRKDKDL